MQVTERHAIEQAIANTVKFRRFWRTKVKPGQVDLNEWDSGTRACLGGLAVRYFKGGYISLLLGTKYNRLFIFGARCGPTLKTRLAQGKADWQEGDDRLTEHLRQLRELIKP